MQKKGIVLIERNKYSDYDLFTGRIDLNTFDYFTFFEQDSELKGRTSIEYIPKMSLINPEMDINSIIFIDLTKNF